MDKPSLAILAGTLFLAGCELSEKQCVEGNWPGIGLKDGLNGQSSEYVQKHEKACSKHSVSVDVTEWERGRQQGLKTYCTPQAAFDLGKKGRSLRAVCDPSKLAVLKAANDKGEKYHYFTQRIRSLENERSNLRSEYRDIASNPEDPGNAARMNYIRLEILNIDLDISILERRRRPYAYL